MTPGQQKVLHLLRDAGERGVLTADFIQAGCGNRFGGRICELRKDFDCEIRTETVRQGSARYVLLDGPPGREPAVEDGRTGGGSSPPEAAVIPSLFEQPALAVPPTPHWAA